MSFLSGKLNTTEEALGLLHGDANATNADVDALTEAIDQLELSVKELRQRVYNAKNANFQGEASPSRPDKRRRIYSRQFLSQGALDTISSAHAQSVAAESRANASATDPGSALEQSATRRRATEDKMSSSDKEFERRHQRNAKKLDKLSEELDQLDLTPLSEQVRTVDGDVRKVGKV